MPNALTIRIKKNADGRASLSCTRADGTATWHRHEGAQAGFFPRHDLTHYAVESVVTHLHGFYSLVAAGWDLSDFGTTSPRGNVPAEADSVEAIVGFLDLERASGNIGTVEDLNAYLAARRAEQGYAPLIISSEDLALIRLRRGELFAKWDALPPGEALELPFND
jgi:hypothetical protein